MGVRGVVKPILLAESSQTRRRASSAQLAQRGYAVTALASLDEAFALLQRAADSAHNFDAVVLGWPEYADGTIEDVFGLLHGARYEHLPVLILADTSSPSAVNWRMTRPHTSLLLWSDYNELADALDQILRPRALAQTSLDQPGAALRLLLVDDSATVRLAFGRLLEKHGYVVETANDVADGHAKAQAMPFDIAIIDYFMPDARGTELIARL